MKKEIISTRMALSLYVLFCFGTNAIIGVSSEADNDSWVALLLSFIAFLPIAYIYARTIKLHPGKNILDVSEIIFGKVIGKFFQVMFLTFTVILAALAMRNTTEFINIIMLKETPLVPLMVTLILMTIYLSMAGIEVMGRWSLVIFVITVSSLVITFVFSLENMEIENIQPMFNTDIVKLLDSTLAIFTFPIAETVVFLLLTDSLSKRTSPYKLFFLGGILSLVVLLAVFFRNHLTLGEISKIVTFSSYVASRLIQISMYFSRVEGLITTNFILLGFLKMSICTLASAEGFAKVFGISERKKIAFPVGLFVMMLSGVFHENVLQMFEFIAYYKIYAIPFQIIFPVIIWAGAELKAWKENKKKKASEVREQDEDEDEQDQDEQYRSEDETQSQEQQTQGGQLKQGQTQAETPEDAGSSVAAEASSES